MGCALNIFLQLVVIFYSIPEITSLWEFTNSKCIALDKKFGDFEYCYLKSLNRTYKYLSLKYYLFQVPVTKIKINLALFKRFSGYRPFLYNVTIDACRFLNNPDAYPINKYFYSYIVSCSNMNHTCPYNHDLVLDKLTASNVNHQVTKVLPFPEGDYMLQVTWMAYDLKRAVTKFYGTLS